MLDASRRNCGVVPMLFPCCSIGVPYVLHTYSIRTPYKFHTIAFVLAFCRAPHWSDIPALSSMPGGKARAQRRAGLDCTGTEVSGRRTVAVVSRFGSDVICTVPPWALTIHRAMLSPRSE